MSNLGRAEDIAEGLRREPYHTLTNDCIIKSFRMKKMCAREGIKARVVACIGVGGAHLFGRRVTIPVIHGWVEIEGKRIETSRPLGSAGIWGIVPVEIKPVIAIRL